MKLTVQLQILPDPAQRKSLLDTIKRFNAAASFAARAGFDAKVFGQPAIHSRCYRKIREKFQLPAQLAVRAIGKAVECFKRDKKTCPEFKELGAIIYDQRIMRFKGFTHVSLTVSPMGRIVVPMVFGDYQKQRIGALKGQADLVYRQGKFYLLATAELPDKAPITPVAAMGVDFGIVQIATTSDGDAFSGAFVEACRRRHKRHRAALNRIGTKSARRRLTKIRKREANFRRNTNHCISKRIVESAQRTGRAIAVEELTGIRERVKSKGPDARNRLGGWAFSQLRLFIGYKAQLAGVPVFAVDPRNTSRTCHECGHCEKANRKSQPVFECVQCGYSANADHNAAINIAARARVNAPTVGIVAGIGPLEASAESGSIPTGTAA